MMMMMLAMATDDHHPLYPLSLVCWRHVSTYHCLQTMSLELTTRDPQSDLHVHWPNPQQATTHTHTGNASSPSTINIYIYIHIYIWCIHMYIIYVYVMHSECLCGNWSKNCPISDPNKSSSSNISAEWLNRLDQLDSHSYCTSWAERYLDGSRR